MQAHGHPRGIIQHRHVNRFANLSKVNDLVDLRVDLVRGSPDPQSPVGLPAAPFLCAARRSGSFFVSPSTEPLMGRGVERPGPRVEGRGLDEERRVEWLLAGSMKAGRR